MHKQTEKFICQEHIIFYKFRTTELYYYQWLVAQSCLILCYPMDCSPPRLCPWDFPGKNIGVGCHFLLQGIFLTQGSNLCPLRLLHVGRFFTVERPEILHISYTLYQNPWWVLQVIVTSILYHKGILEQYNLSKYKSTL